MTSHVCGTEETKQASKGKKRERARQTNKQTLREQTDGYQRGSGGDG